MRRNMLPVVVVDSVVTESVAVFINMKNIEHVQKPDRPFLYHFETNLAKKYFIT